MFYPDLPLEQACKKILDRGLEICLVTMGEKGSFFLSGKGSVRIQVLEVNIVEQIRCGDSFVGGFLTQAIKNNTDINDLQYVDLYEFVRFADTVASLTATRHGAMPAML